MTYYTLNEIWGLEVSFLLKRACVSLVVVMWKWRNTYFIMQYFCIFMAVGAGLDWFLGGGLSYYLWSIFYILFIQQVVEKVGVHFFNLYGSFVPGFCGMSVIIIFRMAES